MSLYNIYTTIEDKTLFLTDITILYKNKYGDYEFLKYLIKFFQDIASSENKITVTYVMILTSLIGHSLLNTDDIYNVLHCYELFMGRKQMIDYYNTKQFNKKIDINLLEKKLGIRE